MVQVSLATVAAGAINTKALAAVVEVPGTVSVDIREGAKISAIYVEMWVQSDDAALGTVIATVEKLPGSASVMTTTEAGALMDYDNKKNILVTHMGLIPNNVTYPMAIIREWIKIPKSKQRFGVEDSIMLNIFAQSNGLSMCGHAIYKEQY